MTSARYPVSLTRNVTCSKTKRIGNTIAVDLMGEVASDSLLIGGAAASMPARASAPRFVRLCRVSSMRF